MSFQQLVNDLNQARLDKAAAVKREDVARVAILEYMEQNQVTELNGDGVKAVYRQNKPKETFEEERYLEVIKETDPDVYGYITKSVDVLDPSKLEELIITGKYDASKLIEFTTVKPGNKVLKLESVE